MNKDRLITRYAAAVALNIMEGKPHRMLQTTHPHNQLRMFRRVV
jgi:hypothetical protein